MDNQFEKEVLERLTRIETKIDDYESIKRVSQEADVRSKQNERRIQEIEDKNKWLKNTVMGAIIASLVALLFAFLRLGMGV